ncbi:MAG: hypothetical protein HRU75_02115 [Planctomycetia bacterium]|nr:hypothetical protein [Phycisphaerales bacterium]QOJ13506.1 MAG: hypothetical protein HRU75_02115 [Planctomycetia bacterium]
MNLRAKLILAVVAAGGMLQLGGCSAGNLMRLLGDIAGDALWLGAID